MACTIITEEKSKEINDPNYLYKCKGCGIILHNFEYTRSVLKRESKGRRYVTRCKSCRREYHKTEKSKSRKRENAPKLRKKHRISSIYWSSVINARAKGWEHSITREDLNEIFIIQNGLCYYTNQPMLKDISLEEDNNESVSIDRFDTSKGYTKDNIVLCRWIVNKMKNDIKFEKFLQVVSQINNNFNK